MGWVRMLSQQNPDPAFVAHGIQVIERNVRAQMKLIEDLLDVSRVITGKLKLQVQNVDLSRLVANALDAVRTAADGKNICIFTRFDVNTRCEVRVDPDRMQQAIWNLLTNSIKFTPVGGEVVIELNWDEQHVRLAVIDNGIGIRKDFLPYVFDRFRQADGSTTRTFGGLGIGLAIVRHIVELHGGVATAESEGEGQGTRLTVSLPRQVPIAGDVYEAERPAPAPVNPQLAGRQILLVEDDPDTRLLITTILEQNGLEVTAVSNAAEALDALNLVKPDLLISDIGMPGEDGYSLIRKIRLRSSDEGGQVPAIALTAYAKDEDRSRAISAGFQHHIAKPLEPDYLLGIIATAIAKSEEPAKT